MFLSIEISGDAYLAAQNIAQNGGTYSVQRLAIDSAVQQELITSGLCTLETNGDGVEYLTTTDAANYILGVGRPEPEPPKRLAAYAFHIRSRGHLSEVKATQELIGDLVSEGYGVQECHSVTDGEGGAVTFMYYVNPSRLPFEPDGYPDHK